MLSSLLLKRNKPLTKANATKIEQFTLTVSLCAVFILVISSLGYGLFIGSDLVITNGIFSLFFLLGSGLKLAASKFVTRQADNKFQYGYWHVEPLGFLLMECYLLGSVFTRLSKGLKPYG